MRPFFNVSVTKKVYNMMITPLMTYCGNLHLCLTKIQRENLNSIERRYNRIINSDNVKVNSIENSLKRKACKTVKKCLNNLVCENFKDYFEINKHDKCTRNKNKLIKLPKIRLEYGRKSFYYTGSKLYNSLPLDLRNIQSFSEFASQVDKFFV